jgi:probable F420-dependent oxidoreductase
MRLGVVVRNMGPASTAATLLECARAAEDAGFADVWVTDHVAIPPDDAEGSDGRYLDPLATLAFLAGATQRIGLGTGVLVLPYRPVLPTAKAVATVQELSGGRLRLGVGAGWMEAEFRALEVDRRRRGALTDDALAFLRGCFERDEVERGGQRFLFRPRPVRPPLYVGGAPPHALHRAVRYGDGWMPMGGRRERLEPAIRELRELADAAGRPPLEVVAMAGLPDEPAAARDRVRELEEIGVTHLVCGLGRYGDAAGFRRGIEPWAELLG